jgi:hypothetical protein
MDTCSYHSEILALQKGDILGHEVSLDPIDGVGTVLDTKGP